MNAQAQALMAAHRQHILSTAQDINVILPEVDAFMAWLATQTVSNFINVTQVQTFASQRILGLPATDALRSEIVNVIQGAFDHPLNATTKLSSLVPDESIERIAKFFSEQTQHREQLVHEILHNPTYIDMLSQTISHAISDYMENNVLTKNVPGVSSLMKFGKGMLEKATSNSLDGALQQYLSKNINNLTAVSEKMANKHLTNAQVYALIKQSWNTIKNTPVSDVRKYADTQTVIDTADMVHVTWEHLRIDAFITTQVSDGIAGWYKRNADKNIMTLLAEVNVDADLVRQQVTDVVMPIVSNLVTNGYLEQRVTGLLQAFYASEAVSKILAAT